VPTEFESDRVSFEGSPTTFIVANNSHAATMENIGQVFRSDPQTRRIKSNGIRHNRPREEVIAGLCF